MILWSLVTLSLKAELSNIGAEFLGKIFLLPYSYNKKE